MAKKKGARSLIDLFNYFLKKDFNVYMTKVLKFIPETNTKAN